MFHANRADILICDYRSADPMRLWPRWHLDFDQPILLFSRQPLSDLQQLRDQPVGWLLGYDFDRYLPVSVKSYEVATDLEGFTLLQHGRLTAFISYQMYLPKPLKSQFYGTELQLRSRCIRYFIMILTVACWHVLMMQACDGCIKVAGWQSSLIMPRFISMPALNSWRRHDLLTIDHVAIHRALTVPVTDSAH